MALITAPLDLGDIFDKTVKLIGKTAKRNVVVAAIIVLPLTIVVALIGSSIMQDFAATMLVSAQMTEAGRTLSESEARTIGMAFLNLLPMFFGVGALFMIGTTAAESAIIRINCSEVDGGDITWREALNTAFGGAMWRLIGQRILFVLALFGAYVATVLTGVISPYLLILSIPGLIAACVWLWTRWFFAPQAIVNEENGVVDSFGRSADLVKGQFGRVLGIGILLAIITSIAISIVTTPIQMVAMSGFWSGYMDIVTNMGTQGNEAERLRAIASMLSGMGPGIGVSIGLQTILTLMVQSSYQVVMYYDACARRGELVEAEDDAPLLS
ncbi:MAG: hypothetical protein IT211_05675 [Armatimonadetes bacterium]|nr:hypothetical protein [Armatimonadota bacterium]